MSMMSSTEDCMCNDISETLDGARVRCVLAQRNMSARAIIIGGEFRKKPPKMLFVDHDQMIGALAPDRPDKAVNMAVLPRIAE
jgi:hypothetical protein